VGLRTRKRKTRVYQWRICQDWCCGNNEEPSGKGEEVQVKCFLLLRWTSYRNSLKIPAYYGRQIAKHPCRHK